MPREIEIDNGNRQAGSQPGGERTPGIEVSPRVVEQHHPVRLVSPAHAADDRARWQLPCNCRGRPFGQLPHSVCL